MVSKVIPLSAAIRTHVRPGMHLNFASTPSRSNAAARELARCFRGTSPNFTLSSTGFHSMAHLLAMLRLGKRYIACFFGDNYPVPRPNALYSQLLREGAQLEHWSLWSYVTALRAGALGQPYGLTSSLVGTTVGAELMAAGKFHQVPDPADPDRQIGLVSALRSDITFVHAALGDTHGNIIAAAPYSEGYWGALGARLGVIATVERVIEPGALAALQEAIKIPAQRVLAVCEEPFGAHPQPLYASRALGIAGYADDFEHYQLWRTLSQDADQFERFAALVLRAEDGAVGYRNFVGVERLEALRIRPTTNDQRPTTNISHHKDLYGEPRVAALEPRSADLTIVRAARVIVERVRARGYQALLAGIGQAFFAARLARLRLAELGIEVAVMVETGMYDLECGPEANGFLLSYDTIARARRLSSVEDVLGTLTCGADNRCLGVIGAAQIDPRGDVNSTRLANGRLLVGSGGANDIASAAAEVIVLTACERSRLVPQVDYITSPGRAVLSVVTDLCTFRRAAATETRWTIEDLDAMPGMRSTDAALDLIRSRCAWDELAWAGGTLAPRISRDELDLLHSLDPQGLHW
ncbi:MAG TPA: CoA-transferase [Roseiflexaceae bacterium]|nr:CoA-transferase [Roseiflexaceae bacterium]